jgi:hypothetical protein
VAGSGQGVTIAPPFAHNAIARELDDYIISVILKGMKGAVSGKKYDAQMVPMEGNDDAWIAAVASYVRNSFSNSAPMVRTSDVARVRETIKSRKEPWTEEELATTMPQILTNRVEWVATANYNAKTARLAIDGNIKTHYDSGTEQIPGMWFQVELPKETMVAGLRLDAAGSEHDYPRGFKVELSSDGKNWGAPVAERPGTRSMIDISFNPTKGKFVRITQTGSDSDHYWSIHELTLYAPGVVSKSMSMAKPAPGKFE